MVQQFISANTVPRAGGGDKLKIAFTKVNSNFTELFSISPTIKGPYVIVITGQSNAAGSKSGGPNPASSSVSTWDGQTNTWGSSDYTEQPWSRSSPHGNSSMNNVALARAHRIAADTGRKVYIVYDAVGGTSIDQWVASGTSSTRYAAIKTKTEAALATLGLTKIDELIWAQGEEDFLDDFATHLDNLTLLRNQLRAETWCGYETPIYMMGPSNLHDRYQWQNAIQYFCSKVDSRCIFVPSNGLRTDYDTVGAGTPTPGSGDYTHFLGESLWEAGYYRIADSAATESAPTLFFGRGVGPANHTDPTVLTTFSSLVSFDSWSSNNSPTGPAATGSITWGFQCSADGNYTYTLGYLNTTDNLCNYTMLTGRENTANSTGDYGLSSGFENKLGANYGFATGRGHIIADTGGTAVGTFSGYVTAQTDPVMFQVGSGASSGSRKTPFAVRASGIQEQVTVTVAQLPLFGTIGRRSFVTDATATTFGSTVSGGGGNKVPVYDDGTAWKIG